MQTIAHFSQIPFAVILGAIVVLELGAHLKTMHSKGALEQPISEKMVLTQKPQALDRDLQPLKVGDHIRFIARGFFHPREQESFGKIVSIDDCGGVQIAMIAGYKHFLTSKKIGHIAETFYFTHHRYDAEKHARVYSVQEGAYELFISIFECYKEPAS